MLARSWGEAWQSCSCACSMCRWPVFRRVGLQRMGSNAARRGSTTGLLTFRKRSVLVDNQADKEAAVSLLMGQMLRLYMAVCSSLSVMQCAPHTPSRAPSWANPSSARDTPRRPACTPHMRLCVFERPLFALDTPCLSHTSPPSLLTLSVTSGVPFLCRPAPACPRHTSPPCLRTPAVLV